MGRAVERFRCSRTDVWSFQKRAEWCGWWEVRGVGLHGSLRPGAGAELRVIGGQLQEKAGEGIRAGGVEGPLTSQDPKESKFAQEAAMRCFRHEKQTVAFTQEMGTW